MHALCPDSNHLITASTAPSCHMLKGMKNCCGTCLGTKANHYIPLHLFIFLKFSVFMTGISNQSQTSLYPWQQTISQKGREFPHMNTVCIQIINMEAFCIKL